MDRALVRLDRVLNRVSNRVYDMIGYRYRIGCIYNNKKDIIGCRVLML